MEKLKTPSTGAEFERNFHLLQQKELAGQIKIAPHLSRTLAGLERRRALPNGRTDFLSIDESARLQANMMANMLNFVPEKPADGTGETAGNPAPGDEPAPEGSSPTQ